MTSVYVTSPSLVNAGTSNIVYVDASGNIGVISPSDIILTTPKNYVNLLTVDSNNNFSTIPSNQFNGCHVNSEGTLNGTPKTDGTCVCSGNWSGTTPGDGCSICDGTTSGDSTHMDGTFGPLAGAKCQFSKATTCNGRGNVNGNGVCKCNVPPIYESTLYNDDYAGTNCQYSRKTTCNNLGIPDDNGNCICAPGYTTLPGGEKCKGVIGYKSMDVVDPRFGPSGKNKNPIKKCNTGYIGPGSLSTFGTDNGCSTNYYKDSACTKKGCIQMDCQESSLGF